MARRMAPKDLLYVYWISHGDVSAFNLDWGVPHGTLASWMEPIGATSAAAVGRSLHHWKFLDGVAGAKRQSR